MLHDLRGELQLPYAGLFVRFYRGAIDNETFVASRREVPAGVPWHDALGSLAMDEVTILR